MIFLKSLYCTPIPRVCYIMAPHLHFLASQLVSCITEHSHPTSWRHILAYAIFSRNGVMHYYILSSLRVSSWHTLFLSADYRDHTCFFMH